MFVFWLSGATLMAFFIVLGWPVPITTLSHISMRLVVFL